MTTFNILVVNPKDKETEIAVYNNYELRYMIARKHSNEELARFDTMYDQVLFRKDIILKELANNQFVLDEVKIVISRGGLVHPVQSGIYKVNDQLKHDLIFNPVGEDIINIGGLLAAAVADAIPGAQAIIADPTVVDELQDIARVTGVPGILRKSIFHALNQKAVGILHAETHKLKYEDLNLIIVHMGNGTTVGAHREGRVIDVNQGFAGDGPFSLVRAGTLPLGDIVELCFSGTKTKDEIECLITHCGGLNGLLGTTSINEVEKRIKNGDEQAKLVLEAMAYQVAKCIGEMFAVLKGKVDAILITGDVAYSDFVVRIILEHVEKFAPTFIYPGDNEIKAMAANALRVIKGDTVAKTYS